MQNKFSTENLQVGDKVIVIFSGLMGTREYIGEIVKKTPTGLVDVCYGNKTTIDRFKKNGQDYARHDLYSRTYKWIEEYTEERADNIRKNTKRTWFINFLREREWSTYDNEELEQICNFIKGLRST